MSELYPTYIAGKVTLSDGSETEFSLQPDMGWQQWGNSTEKLIATADLMEALAAAAYEHGMADEDEKLDEDYVQMLSDFEAGECAVIHDNGSVFFCRKMICHPGTPESDHMGVIKARMESEQFWPRIYSVNDHGNVSLLDSDGNEVKAWV